MNPGARCDRAACPGPACRDLVWEKNGYSRAWLVRNFETLEPQDRVFLPLVNLGLVRSGEGRSVPSPGGSSTGGEIRELPPPAVLFTEYGTQSCIRIVHYRAPREVASCSLFSRLRGTYGRSKGSSGAAEILSTGQTIVHNKTTSDDTAITSTTTDTSFSPKLTLRNR